MELPKAIVVDTNVLIHDPEAIELLMNDVNILFLHSIVIQELDNNKTKRDIGRDCREAIRKIEELHKTNHPRFKIIRQVDWSDPTLFHLDKDKNDHHIIALAHNLKYKDEYKEVKLISKDTTVRILSRDLDILAEDYISERVVIDNTSLREVEVPSNIIESSGISHTFTLPDMKGFIENEGVICWSDWDGAYQPQSNSEWSQSFVATKKGDSFHIINNQISLMGMKPYSINGDGPNWEQYVAMSQLMDPKIKLSFLVGGAGSGKTIISLAAALEQRKMFRNILVTRPMVHLEDEDRMGFLPGDINQKMDPWLRPIFRSLSFISQLDKDNQSIINKVRDNNKMEIEPLDYIRGMTYVRDILIVDEAQNLTPHQIKTIITRAGENSKIIFTGDLGQIDRKKKIDANTSGLAYASVKMSDNKMVSTVYFKKTVRSPLADLAERVL